MYATCTIDVYGPDKTAFDPVPYLDSTLVSGSDQLQGIGRVKEHGRDSLIANDDSRQALESRKSCGVNVDGSTGSREVEAERQSFCKATERGGLPAIPRPNRWYARNLVLCEGHQRPWVPS